MQLKHLTLWNFRSYPHLDLELFPGRTVFLGANGYGKTNVVEALGYLTTLNSHRVSQDGPLIHHGQESAIIQATLLRGDQQLILDVEINAQGANRARINKANPVKTREILGLARSVLFAPEDLHLVKGDPGNRRRFLDETIQQLSLMYVQIRSDYDKVLKQRNALLKTARSSKNLASIGNTLEVWDHHLAEIAAKVLHERLTCTQKLLPQAQKAYGELSSADKELDLRYLPSFSEPATSQMEISELETLYLQQAQELRHEEIDRGITLWGPHREELELSLNRIPVRGFASQGESWSVALALRIASYHVLLQEQLHPYEDPILVLDDVFSELDEHRRRKLVDLTEEAEQVLVTAAVAADLPENFATAQYRVTEPGVVKVA